jgi:15-cis-phytoene synthase
MDEVADAVRRGDPDRWRTAMLAPAAAQPGLMALYGFNLELARAPWAASEPALAAIRLTWWREAVAEVYDGKPPRPHAVLRPLAETVASADLPRRLLDGMIDARLSELDGPVADAEALESYVDHTAGHLMELAARHLGAGGAALPVVRDFARGAGTAALLAALPELRARGRDPLPAGVDVAALARQGLAAIGRARAHRGRIPAAAAPALLAGWQADRVLRQVAEGRPAVAAAPAAARAALLWRGLTGRW